MATNGDSKSHSDSLETTVPLLIDGKDFKSKTTFDVDSPADEQVAWKVHAASVSDANHAVETAQKAFPSWSRTSPSERRDIFLKAANIIEGKSEELTNIMKKETGATSHWAGFNIVTTVEMLRDIAGRIATAVEGFIPWCADTHTNAMVLKEPYGVILGIAPWYEGCKKNWSCPLIAIQERPLYSWNAIHCIRNRCRQLRNPQRLRTVS